MTRQAAAVAVAAAEAGLMDINALLVRLAPDAQNRHSSVRRCRIIRVQRISMLRGP
jgi:hypothetical protein